MRSAGADTARVAGSSVEVGPQDPAPRNNTFMVPSGLHDFSRGIAAQSPIPPPVPLAGGIPATPSTYSAGEDSGHRSAAMRAGSPVEFAADFDPELYGKLDMAAGFFASGQSSSTNHCEPSSSKENLGRSLSLPTAMFPHVATWLEHQQTEPEQLRRSTYGIRRCTTF